jgi:glycosyltransferase involved in cell wall biosynthesis
MSQELEVNIKSVSSESDRDLSSIAIVTICSNNYFPYARVLFSSIHRYHPEAELFLCLADIKSEIEFGIDGVEIIEAKDLEIPDFWDFAFRYDIMEFNTAVKPFVIRTLLEKRNFDRVIYLDPDIELFAPMTPVIEALETGANFVITPHLTAPAETEYYPNDIAIMKCGIYNLGFFAASNSEETLNFLRWWGRRLRFYCINQQDEGIFVDQKFIDLLPSFSDRVKILRDTNLNVAYWNLWQRNLNKTVDEWEVDGKPLLFFHFSGIDSNNPDRLSKHTSRFRKDLEPPLQSLIARYIAQLKYFRLKEIHELSYGYGSFEGGIPITDLMRHCYRNLEEIWLDNPFKTFHRFLNEPYWRGSAKGLYPLTNLMYYFYSREVNLQKLFNLDVPEGRRNYTKWFVQNAAEYGIDGYFISPILDRLAEQSSGPRSFSPASPTEPDDSDICVIGYLTAEMGVGQAGRSVLKSFATTDARVRGFNVSVNVTARQSDRSVESLLSSVLDSRVQIYSVNADQLAVVAETVAPLCERSPRYRINMPFWELCRFPPDWIASYRGFDEIWAPTRFIQASVQGTLDLPVVWMPPAVAITDFEPVDRSRFNLPAGVFLFLFNFDFSSYSTRKNPMAAIEAYRLAFRHHPLNVPTALAIKTMGCDVDGKNLERLLKMTEEEPDIIIIDEQMNYSDVLALMNCCDCYVSLHRSEGFGYTLAEAMLLGKPVIATDYSGTRDFIDRTNAYPVKYRLKPLEKNDYPFGEGQKWADPDLEHAAWLMRRAIEDEAETRKIALAGQSKIQNTYSTDVVGRRYLDRLRKIGVL